MTDPNKYEFEQVDSIRTETSFGVDYTKVLGVDLHRGTSSIPYAFAVDDWDVHVTFTRKYTPGWYRDDSMRTPGSRCIFFEEKPVSPGWVRVEVTEE